MKARAAGPAASTLATLLVACSLHGSHRPPQADPPLTRSAYSDPRVSQIGFAADARFVSCLGQECPVVTPKVLAAARLPDPVDVSPGQSPAAPVRTPALPKEQDAALREPYPITKSAASRRSQVLTLFFRTDHAKLTAAHTTRLNEALPYLRLSDLIVISGRTDDTGSTRFNQALALARALAVRDRLLDLEPNLPARIAIDARGRCCYAEPNDTPAGRAHNRRVAVAFTPAEVAEP